MLNNRLYYLCVLLFCMSWYVQAKPDILRRLIPFETVTDAFIVNCGAIIGYLLTYVIIGGIFEYTNPAEKSEARMKDMYKQIYLSVQAIFICVVYAILWMFYIDPILPYYGYYNDIEYTPIDFLKNLACYVFIFDTWFFWTHRALHLRGPFFNFWKNIHLVHHQFVEHTTAFAQDATHWFEALVQGPMGHGLIYALVPMHPLAGQLFGFLTATYALGAHDGRWFDWNNHIKHHHYVNVNFGLYWGFWDYICGTRWVDGIYPHAKEISSE